MYGSTPDWDSAGLAVVYSPLCLALGTATAAFASQSDTPSPPDPAAHAAAPPAA